MSGAMEGRAGEFRELAEAAMEIVERYYAELADHPIMPVTTASAVRDLLDEGLPEDPTAGDGLLATVREVIYPLSRHNAHPRFFGYVASPGTAIAAIGDLLASGLNANVTSWRSAPAGAQLEHTVIDWLKKIVGFSEAGTGVLVSGGSMANFCGLAAARAAADPEMARWGGGGRPPLRVYVSSEGHFSIQKAARMLGIGADNVQFIATDDHLRIDMGELALRVAADRRAGFRPMCVVGNAGTVNTGAFDPIEELADFAQGEGLWLHVDGAYGGFSALAPSARPLFGGIERADSMALDPHKWLYSSMGCGCALYRDPGAAMAAFAQHAEYTRPVGLSHDEAFVFWDYSPELSRPFRALTVWLQIKRHGVRELGAAVESNLACAVYAGKLIEEAEDLELLAPVGLSIFCFRYRPPGFTGDLDALNERILVELQRGGSSYLSNARVFGKFALRGCVLNYRTTVGDMERLIVDVRAAAREVCSR
jgi:aromatic-L-amino-acid/L-tryptophan decarboxylase